MNPADDYHSALRPEGDWPPLMRFQVGTSVAFCHDATLPLPDAFESCDVLYSEPPWRKGVEEFNRRAGVPASAAVPWPDMVRHWGRVAVRFSASGRPVVYAVGKEFLKYVTPQHSRPVRLNGGEVVLAGWGQPLPPGGDVVDVLRWLAARYDRVGDFCAGYGRAGRAFAEAGKSFVLSELSPKCIGYIAAHAAGWFPQPTTDPS